MILEDLLENYLILKEDDKQLYYDIKDNIHEYSTFLKDDLDYNLIIKDDFIKLEKIPAHPEQWMGIKDFSDIKEYIFFMILLMFLENKSKGEQFILSNLTSYIDNNYKYEKIDWSVFKNRKYLINVINISLKIRIIKKTDGDEENFSKSENANVLYENTGLSRYVVRRFKKDISDIDTYDQLLESEEEGVDLKKKAYRQILLCPVVYNDHEEYEYIRKNASLIRNKFEKNTNYDVHIHKNGAILAVDPETEMTDVFPGKDGESNAVLFINRELRDLVISNKFNVNYKDEIRIDKERFKEIVVDVRKKDGHGFVKSLRNCSDELFVSRMKKFMMDFSMIREEEENIILLPIVFKSIGKYPDDYLESIK